MGQENSEAAKDMIQRSHLTSVDPSLLRGQEMKEESPAIRCCVT